MYADLDANEGKSVRRDETEPGKCEETSYHEQESRNLKLDVMIPLGPSLQAEKGTVLHCPLGWQFEFVYTSVLCLCSPGSKTG